MFEADEEDEPRKLFDSAATCAPLMCLSQYSCDKFLCRRTKCGATAKAVLTVCISAALPHSNFEPRLQSSNGPPHRTQHSQKPLFSHQTSYPTTGTHRGSLRGRSPLRKDKCEALIPFLSTASPKPSSIATSTPPSVSSKSPSFTPFFALFPAYSTHPSQILCKHPH